MILLTTHLYRFDTQDMEYSIFLNEIEKVWDVRPSIYERVLFTFIAFLGGSDVIETLGGYKCHVLKIVLYTCITDPRF